MIAELEPPVTFAGDEMRVHFTRFGSAAYARFLQVKKLPESTTTFDPADETYTVTAPARFAAMLGAERPHSGDGVPLAGHLFPDQALLCRQALDAKRFALWCQCGWGKTPTGLEFARQVWLITGGRVLIITLNEIVNQWLEEAAKFYGDTLPIVRLESRAAMREWCKNGEPGLAITNYEKFNPDEQGQVVNECRHLAGVVLDEASRLKAGGGKQKWALIKSFKGLEYKLNLTATPAPNDLMEYASQASFLEKMRTEQDIIWTFFTRDPKTQKWTVKPHARRAFFEFMATWSVYVNDPKRYGWRLDMPDVPAPEYITVAVKPTPEQMELARVATADQTTGQMDLFGGGSVGIVGRGKLSQLAKGFRYVKGALNKRCIEVVKSHKPDAVAKIVEHEAGTGAQVLVWTVFDAESDILSARLAKTSHELLTGKTPTEERVNIIERFRTGETRVLIGRAGMLGYGLNFQFCTAMVFSGWSDSFESMYQAIRRAVRFGQEQSVRVYFPVIAELEGDTLDNVRRKESEFMRAIEEMENSYISARRGLKGVV